MRVGNRTQLGERPSRVEPIVIWGLLAGCFFIALARTLPRHADPRIWRFSALLVFAGICGLAGWRYLRVGRAWKRYIAVALVVSACAVASLTASWTRLTFYNGRILVLWFAFIVPGLASLYRERRFRDATAAGFTAGVAILLSVAMSRVVRGDSAFDLGDDVAPATVLGVNRNAVNIMALIVVPLLLSAQLPRFLRLLRYPLFALICVWMFVSGGRAGLVALPFVGLIYVLLQPGTTRRLQLLYASLSIVAVAVFAVQQFGDTAGESAERLSQTVEGESLPGDETRRLLFRKSWHFAIENPVFGIGFGRFRGSYHPVVEDASTSAVRRNAIDARAHGTFTTVMAEGGFTTFIAFVALLLVLIRDAIRHRRSAAVRAGLAGVAGLVLVMIVEFVLDPLFYIPIAFLLGAIGEHEDRLVAESVVS